MGHAEVMALHDVIARYWWQQGLRRPEPDRVGLLRAAGRERRDQARREPGGLHLRQHRDPGRVVPPLRDLLRLVAPAEHLRPGVLPLDAVAVPEVPRAGAGLPQVLPGQLVPQRPDRAGQRAGRAGHVRALRRRGHQARAVAVVLQGHRLRPAAAGRHGAAGGHLARRRCWPCSATGSAAPRARTSTSSRRGRPATTATRIRVFTTRPDTLFGATFMVVAADAKLAAEICAPEQRQALEDYLVEVRKATDIDRLATDRPKTGVDLGVTAVNPVNGERIPVWAADYVLADYGTGAIMAVPGAGPARPGVRHEVRPAGRSAPCSPREGFEESGGEAFTGAGAGDQLRQRRVSLDGLTSTRPRSRDHRLAGGRRAPARGSSTSGCATGC